MARAIQTGTSPTSQTRLTTYERVHFAAKASRRAITGYVPRKWSINESHPQIAIHAVVPTTTIAQSIGTGV